MNPNRNQKLKRPLNGLYEKLIHSEEKFGREIYSPKYYMCNCKKCKRRTPHIKTDIYGFVCLKCRTCEK